MEKENKVKTGDKVRTPDGNSGLVVFILGSTAYVVGINDEKNSLIIPQPSLVNCIECDIDQLTPFDDGLKQIEINDILNSNGISLSSDVKEYETGNGTIQVVQFNSIFDKPVIEELTGCNCTIHTNKDYCTYNSATNSKEYSTFLIIQGNQFNTEIKVYQGQYVVKHINAGFFRSEPEVWNEEQLLFNTHSLQMVIARMEKEKGELLERLTKLGDFLDGQIYESLSETDKRLLNEQYKTMTQYNGILEVRIIRMKNKIRSEIKETLKKTR